MGVARRSQAGTGISRKSRPGAERRGLPGPDDDGRRFRKRTLGGESRPAGWSGAGPGPGAGAGMGTERPQRQRIERPAWAGSAWYTSPQLQRTLMVRCASDAEWRRRGSSKSSALAGRVRRTLARCMAVWRRSRPMSLRRTSRASENRAWEYCARSRPQSGCTSAWHSACPSP